MGTVTYFGTGSRTVFITPKSLANKTATVDGITATIASQDHLSVTFSVAPAWRKAVVITTYDTDLETVAETTSGTPVGPRTEGATVTLVPLDNTGISQTPVACVVTVNTGLGVGFGRGFTGAGAVSFAGSATVLDKRNPGASNPACGLFQVAQDTYWAIGGKA